MANEYAILDELKDRMGVVDPSDTTDDATLQRKLTTASRAIDKDCGRRKFWLDPVALTRVLNPAGRVVQTDDGWKLLVDDIGAADDLLVEVGSGASWTTVTGFELGSPASDDPLPDGRAVEWLLRPRVPWTTWAGQRIRITARWGWPQVPDEIHEACLLRAQRLTRRKHSSEGVAANSDFGPIRVSSWDPDYEALIADFVKPGFA